MKKSPYRMFADWLFNSVPSVQLDDWVIKAVNPRAVLCMFGKLGGITIFLNEHFNNFDIMILDRSEIYSFLRAVVQNYNIKRRDLSFYKHSKLDRTSIELQRQLIFLKKTEIYELLEYAKNDLEYPNFTESLGLNICKKARIKKSDAKASYSARGKSMKNWLSNFIT